MFYWTTDWKQKEAKQILVYDRWAENLWNMKVSVILIVYDALEAAL